jgi:uncharacterized protein (DUF1015 family)
MATVRPFAALRPKKELAARVASPPYDVLNSEEAREMARGNEYSFLHVIKPEIDLDPGVNLYDTTVYLKGAENLNKLIDARILTQDESPSFYVYKQIMGEHQQVGLVACASVEEYEMDLIKKHELTRQEKEDDRVNLIRHLNAHTGPVFLTYKADNNIDKIMEKVVQGTAEYDFIDEKGIRHTLWIVKEYELIRRIQSAFQKVPLLYVADGHHRSAAATRIKQMRQNESYTYTGSEEYNYFLAVIFPHNQMQILDYNRVVKDLNGLDKKEFLEKISERFILSEMENGEPYKPDKKYQFGMYLEDRWYKLECKSRQVDENDPVEKLDVSILQRYVLSPILGIEDPRKDKRIDFVGGIRGLKELEKLVNSGKFQIAFALYPTSMEDLMTVASAGKIMPPKSTWFEPKLRSGLVIHLLD